MTVDPTTGNLFVADSVNNRVVELSVSNGTVVSHGRHVHRRHSTIRTAWPRTAPGCSPSRSATTTACSSSTNRTAAFAATINGSDVTGGGPTSLFDPENVAFGPDGNLYIADTYNDRILVYTISTGGH